MVRDTVSAEAVAVVVDAGAAVCADASAAAANRTRAKEKLFTRVLYLGEIERFLIFYMVRDTAQNAKNRKDYEAIALSSPCPRVFPRGRWRVCNAAPQFITILVAACPKSLQRLFHQTLIELYEHNYVVL